MNPADQHFLNVNTQFNPHPPMPMTATGVLDQVFSIIDRYGVSLFTVLCCFYFIMFLTKSAQRERDAWQKRDEESDERILNLATASSDALLQVKIALEQNTQAMREFIRYKD